MLLGHMAVGLAARRMRPSASLSTWFFAVQLVDLVWPVFLLPGLEHVRVAPGTTPGRASLWLLIAFLLVVYVGAAFGPPPPDARTVAFSALALGLLLPWAKWADR